MNAKNYAIVLAVTTALSACGGGGEGESSQTASNQQTRSELEPDSAIKFVRRANSDAEFLDFIDRFLLLFVPSSSITSAIDLKDVGFLSCAKFFVDPACKGRFRIQTEFPIDQKQQVLRAGSTLTVNWEAIETAQYPSSGPINREWTLKFLNDFSLVSRYTGQFEFTEKRTTPTQGVLSNLLKAEQLSIKSNSARDAYVIDGVLIINPDDEKPGDGSNTLTFKNWSLDRSRLEPGAQIAMYSALFNTNTSTPELLPKARITVTVVSSDAGRTEYRVYAKSDANDLGTTRTVIGTLDSNGAIVYSAS